MNQVVNKLKKIKSGAGFTLIEMIVVVGIFTTVVLIALNLYLTIANIQKRVLSLQKIQEDIRFAVESMAQQIRLSKINYSYYVAKPIGLYPGAATVDTLALLNQTGDKVFFRLNNNKLEYQSCPSTDTDPATICDETDYPWQDVTPAEVKIKNLEFFITPSADPFSMPAGVLNDCPNTACPAGYQCDVNINKCQYFTDGGNFQPKVRIIMATEGVSTQQKERASINIQTTVTSRIAESTVVNDNF